MMETDKVLLHKPEIFVYKIPSKIQRKRGHTHRAKDWDINTPYWHGQLKLLSSGKSCVVQLENQDTGAFGQCSIDNFPGTSFQPVKDSSRYFVLRIQTTSDENQLFGIAFTTRSDSEELTTALEQYFLKSINADSPVPLSPSTQSEVSKSPSQSMIVLPPPVTLSPKTQPIKPKLNSVINETVNELIKCVGEKEQLLADQYVEHDEFKGTNMETSIPLPQAITPGLPKSPSQSMVVLSSPSVTLSPITEPIKQELNSVINEVVNGSNDLIKCEGEEEQLPADQNVGHNELNGASTPIPLSQSTQLELSKSPSQSMVVLPPLVTLSSKQQPIKRKLNSVINNVVNGKSELIKCAGGEKEQLPADQNVGHNELNGASTPIPLSQSTELELSKSPSQSMVVLPPPVTLSSKTRPIKRKLNSVINKVVNGKSELIKCAGGEKPQLPAGQNVENDEFVRSSKRLRKAPTSHDGCYTLEIAKVKEKHVKKFAAKNRKLEKLSVSYPLNSSKTKIKKLKPKRRKTAITLLNTILESNKDSLKEFCLTALCLLDVNGDQLKIPQLTSLHVLTLSKLVIDSTAALFPKFLDIQQVFPNLQTVNMFLSCGRDSALQKYFPASFPISGNFFTVKTLRIRGYCTKSWFQKLRFLFPNVRVLVIISKHSQGSMNIDNMVTNICQNLPQLEEIEFLGCGWWIQKNSIGNYDTAFTGLPHQVCQKLNPKCINWPGDLFDRKSHPAITSLKNLKHLKVRISNEQWKKDSFTNFNLISWISGKFAFNLMPNLRVTISYHKFCPSATKINSALLSLVPYVTLIHEKHEEE